MLNSGLLNKKNIKSYINTNSNEEISHRLSWNDNTDLAFISTLDMLTRYNNERMENIKSLLTESKDVKKFTDDSGRSAKAAFSSIGQVIDNFYDRIRGCFMDDIDYALVNSDYIMKFSSKDTFTMEEMYHYSISKDDTKHLYIVFKNLADKIQKVYDDCNKHRNPEEMIKVFQKFYDDNITSNTEEYVRQIRNTILKRGASAKYINQPEYIVETNKKFHNGDEDPKDIKIDKKYVFDAYEYLRKAKYNELYKTIQNDTEECQELIDKIIFYINAIYAKAAKYNNASSSSKANLAVAIESFCNKIYNSMLCIVIEEVNIYVSIELDCIYQMVYTYAKVLKRIVKQKRSEE